MADAGLRGIKPCPSAPNPNTSE